MKILLYAIALIMVIGWVIGFIFYAIGGLIHLLLMVAAISIMYNLLANKISSA
ncbi:MAG: lmo0937 family membrane protein [Balneolaceae bacterium]|nr:MAG: lmo0937 family membrane protein [Balneolaceae bacterium]